MYHHLATYHLLVYYLSVIYLFMIYLNPQAIILCSNHPSFCSWELFQFTHESPEISCIPDPLHPQREHWMLFQTHFAITLSLRISHPPRSPSPLFLRMMLETKTKLYLGLLCVFASTAVALLGLNNPFIGCFHRDHLRPSETEAFTLWLTTVARLQL